MEQSIKNLEQEALNAINGCKTIEALREVELEYFGRKDGKITNVMKSLKDLPAEQKPKMGQLANTVKITLEKALNSKLQNFENAKLEKELSSDFFDTTIPGEARYIGHIHPVAQVQEEVERIFSQMGFSIMDGPEIESEYYNFEGLNIPADHPARDMQDTFFIADEARSANAQRDEQSGSAGCEPSELINKNDPKHGRMVLRTHTSPVQVRTMEKYGAPLRVIVPGRVFRYEATDASHDSTFNQVEGLLIDKEISLSHLKGVMAEFLTRLFGKPVKVRFRPGYFPFVEPGVELDFSCLLCGGKGYLSDTQGLPAVRQGCRVCKHSGWVEFMGAGMVHENVLKAGGIDSKKYQGWAFGFGLTRLVMMRYGIDDIRLLTGGDLRFLRQF